MKETRRVRLKWHGMLCPRCFADLDLRVTYTGTCKLTPEGSEDVGGHEWNEDSKCRCMRCDFASTVAAFQWGEAGELLEFKADPTGETKDVTFEIQVMGMAPNEARADREHQLAAGLEVEPHYWDLEVVRIVRSTGRCDKLLRVGRLCKGEAADYVTFLIQPDAYPFAEVHWL